MTAAGPTTVVLAAVAGLAAACAVAPPSSIAAPPPFDRPEPAGHDGRLNAAVAEAYAALASGDLAAAAERFAAADALPVFESDNFRLTPQLAWLNHRLGDPAAARRYLAEARLARDVRDGAHRCVEGASGWRLEPAPAAPPAVVESVTSRMCNAFTAEAPRQPWPEADRLFDAKLAAAEALVAR